MYCDIPRLHHHHEAGYLPANAPGQGRSHEDEEDNMP